MVSNLCGLGGRAGSPPREVHYHVCLPSRRGFSIAHLGSRGRMGPTWAAGPAYPPSSRISGPRSPREPRPLFLAKPKGMQSGTQLGLCWAPACLTDRLAAAWRGPASSPLVDPGPGLRPSLGSGCFQASEPPRRVCPADSHRKAIYSSKLWACPLALI